MKATEITRYENGAVKFEFEGEQYTMNHRGVISWATPGGWARVATDEAAFPTVGQEFNSGTVYADCDQTFAGEIIPADAVEESAEATKKLDIEPRGTVYGTRTHRQWSRVISGTVFRFELLGPSAYWKSGPTVRVTRHPYGRYQDETVVHKRMELAAYVDGMEDSRPCTGDREHFLGLCVECDAARMVRMTPDDVESWYHSGHFGQAKYEAYMHAWATSAVRHSSWALAWMEEPTDPKVVEIVAALRRHAGIPAPAELVA